MTTNAIETMNIIRNITTKKDVLKGLIETNEELQAQVELVKEQQEELKAMIAADDECAALQEEIKALTKELNEAAKTTSKSLKAQGVEAKPSEVKAYLTKKVKADEEVDKVVQLGSKFNVLKQKM